ncbi:MAG: hypothetical protein AAF570_20535, partial [Bacteroidota bacterium]
MPQRFLSPPARRHLMVILILLGFWIPGFVYAQVAPTAEMDSLQRVERVERMIRRARSMASDRERNIVGALNLLETARLYDVLRADIDFFQAQFLSRVGAFEHAGTAPLTVPAILRARPLVTSMVETTRTWLRIPKPPSA